MLYNASEKSAALLHNSYYEGYDITGLITIVKPQQTDTSVYARGGAFVIGRNKDKPYLNINVGFGDCITNTYSNNSSAYSPPYGITNGTVEIVCY